MGTALRTRLAATALLAALLTPLPAAAQDNFCCVCSCTGIGVQCDNATSVDECESFFSGCGGANSTCGNAIFNQTFCTAVPACAGGPVAPAPSLDVTGLTAAVILLGGLAAWRLRRRTARQR